MLGSGIFADNPTCDRAHHYKCFVSYPAAVVGLQALGQLQNETKRDIPTRLRRRFLPQVRRLAGAWRG
jgi:hypothetical protein